MTVLSMSQSIFQACIAQGICLTVLFFTSVNCKLHGGAIHLYKSPVNVGPQNSVQIPHPNNSIFYNNIKSHSDQQRNKNLRWYQSTLPPLKTKNDQSLTLNVLTCNRVTRILSARLCSFQKRHLITQNFKLQS